MYNFQQIHCLISDTYIFAILLIMYLYLFEIDKYIHLQLLLYLSKICVCICLKLYNCFIARRRDSQNLVEFSEKLQCCICCAFSGNIKILQQMQKELRARSFSSFWTVLYWNKCAFVANTRILVLFLLKLY